MDWITMAVGIVCALLGLVTGIWIGRRKGRCVGTFVIDRENPEVNGGVYTVFDADPMGFRNGQHVTLDVILVNLGKSQENQGA